MLTNQSSWLNKGAHDKLEADCKIANEVLESQTEVTHNIQFDGATINYKKELLRLYK